MPISTIFLWAGPLCVRQATHKKSKECMLDVLDVFRTLGASSPSPFLDINNAFFGMQLQAGVCRAMLVKVIWDRVTTGRTTCRGMTALLLSITSRQCECLALLVNIT